MNQVSGRADMQYSGGEALDWTRHGIDKLFPDTCHSRGNLTGWLETQRTQSEA